MMKRFLSIIEQDIAIWDLSQPEFKSILAEGILIKKLYWQLNGLTEDDLIDAWVKGFRAYMPRIDCELPKGYVGIDRNATYTWINENPKSYVKL